MLGGEIVVTEVGALLVGGLQRGVCLRRELRLLRGLPVHLGQSRECVGGAIAHDLARHSDALQHREHHALGLADERDEQMLGSDLSMVLLSRQGLGGRERLAGLVRQLVGVERHAFTSERSGLSPKLTTPLSTLFLMVKLRQRQPALAAQALRSRTTVWPRTGTRSRR